MFQLVCSNFFVDSTCKILEQSQLVQFGLFLGFLLGIVVLLRIFQLIVGE